MNPKSSTQAQDLYALIVQIRRAFQDLAAMADTLHAADDITAAQRALMEYLSVHGPETVANIARAKNVSRQHIQQLADQIVADGYAEFQQNPAHKRSQLIALTSRGVMAFANVQSREATALAMIAQEMPSNQVTAATTTIAQLRDVLSAAAPKQNPTP